MFMTEKLYYQDAYLKEFSAVITDVRSRKDRTEVLLDRTAFYPEGGGQGADTGSIAAGTGLKLEVTDVHEADGEIWHTVSVPDGAAPESLTGVSVTGTIDWERRFDHMQQHSGEHIVSGMICSRFNCDNVGFHMGEDMVTIDYNVRITLDEAHEIERMANEYIWEDHPFVCLWPSSEELKTMEYRSKKELEGAVRITSFPGADMCACCGTHVSSSAQVGLVKFISAKNFHEGTRLELLCGRRAAGYLGMVQSRNRLQLPRWKNAFLPFGLNSTAAKSWLL